MIIGNKQVQGFIGTKDYETHKQARFPQADLVVPIQEKEAFLLSDPAIRASFVSRYKLTAALYYNGQPDFDLLLARLKEYLGRL